MVIEPLSHGSLNIQAIFNMLFNYSFSMVIPEQECVGSSAHVINIYNLVIVIIFVTVQLDVINNAVIQKSSLLRSLTHSAPSNKKEMVASPYCHEYSPVN